MKKILLLLTPFILSFSLLATSCSGKGEWALVWQEDFNGPAIDTTVWSRVLQGLSNWNDMMSLREDLAFIEDGQLVLLGKVGGETDATPYVTGGMASKGKKSFRQARIEIRARFNSVRGFWPDKEEEKVKNSRGVAINHLRNSLADVEGLSIVFDKGYYRLVLGEPCYCDVVDLLGQVSSREPDMDRILSVLSRGKFLKHVDDPVFDSYKSRIENGVSPVLQSEIVRRYRSNSWQEVIEIADMILYFDPLDETALKYATSALVRIQRKEDALLRYAAFTSEYRKVNDSDYPVPFEKTIL